MPSAKPNRPHLFLLPALLLACLTLPHLGQGDFRRDTVRYAAVGHYMFDGGDPIAPQLRPGVPYFNKPPLPLWIHGAALKTFGVSLGVARLPSILAAIGVVLLSMLCVRSLASRSEAIVSGFALVLTYEFFRRTREISLDLWQLLFMVAAALFVVRSIRKTGVPVGHFAAAGACIGLALLCKPFVALGAFAVFPIWLAIAGQARRIVPLLAIGILVAAAVAFPWHWTMWSRFGEAFTDQYFGNQIVDRAKGAHGSEGPFFYLTMSEWSTYPWLLAGLSLWVYTRRRPRRGGHRNLTLFGLCWALPFLIGLSCFADKKPNYALIIWPMLAWAIAFGLCRIRVPALSAWHRSGYRWLAPVAIAASLVASLLPLDLQKGKKEELLRVVEWLHQEDIPASDVAFHKLAPNDYCYLYLASPEPRWPNEDTSTASYLVSREKSRPGYKHRQAIGKYRVWKRRASDGG